MLCTICKKNQATIHIQEVVNGVKKSLHICEACALLKGLNLPGFQGIDFAEFLDKLTSVADNGHLELPVINHDTAKENILTCSNCGWNSEKIHKTSRLGCPECYITFKDFISHSLSELHRGTVHHGKRPINTYDRKNAVMLDLLDMQKKLEQYIKREEYEEAAKIRDKLNELRTEVFNNK